MHLSHFLPLYDVHAFLPHLDTLVNHIPPASVCLGLVPRQHTFQTSLWEYCATPTGNMSAVAAVSVVVDSFRSFFVYFSHHVSSLCPPSLSLGLPSSLWILQCLLLLQNLLIILVTSDFPIGWQTCTPNFPTPAMQLRLLYGLNSYLITDAT